MAELRSSRQSAGDAATEWAFTAGWRLVKLLPEAAAYRVFEFAADTLWRRRAGGVEQWERNQRRIHPDMSTAQMTAFSKQGMRSYLRYWCDAFRLPTWSRARVDAFTLDRHELLDAAMAAGTGAIMVVNHGGNWDHAGAWACQRYGGLVTVVERLKPEGLYDRFVEYRETLGMEVIPLGDPDVVRKLARRLQEGRLVALVGDRDISLSGIEVDLFGETASLPAGAAVLAMITGAPLYPVVLWYTPDASTGYIYDRVEVPVDGRRADKVLGMTRRVASSFEQGLRDHSVDWHMMQPVWLADVDPARRRGVSQAGPGVAEPDNTSRRT